MEFRNLYSFLRVAELGSFTKAANELGYAQSTITMHIQQLEMDVGLPLFEHVGRRVTLTAYGSQLIPYVHQILRLQDQIQSLHQTNSAQVYGTLRIGIVESIMYSILLDNIKEYRSRFPNVKIQICPAVTAPLFDMLRSSEVDLIFTLGEKMEAPGCVHSGSLQARAVFIGAPDHPMVQRKDLTLSEVLREPLILTSDTTYIRRELNKAAYARGVELSPHIETVSNSFIISLVRQNMGVSFLPDYLIRSAFLRNEVAILPVTDYELPIHVNIFYHKNKYLTPQMVGLIELIHESW